MIALDVHDRAIDLVVAHVIDAAPRAVAVPDLDHRAADPVTAVARLIRVERNQSRRRRKPRLVTTIMKKDTVWR